MAKTMKKTAKGMIGVGALKPMKVAKKVTGETAKTSPVSQHPKK